jgi:membrane-bound metal-dependent hydrolase YbcI (DUF457 family)
MADFKTHLIGGAAAGVVAALASAWIGWVDWQWLPLVATAGIVGGLAPDVDSESARPQRILFGAAAVIVPSVLLYRVQWLQRDPERAVLSWVIFAALTWWPGRWLFQRATVHRGMLHSLPAVAIFGAIAFLFAGRRAEDVTYQIAVGLTAAVGYLTHLALDELWSVDFEGRTIRVKKSLGTALKPWGKVAWHNGLAWGLVAVLGGLVWKGLDGITVEDLLDGYDDAALEAVEGLRLERR